MKTYEVVIEGLNRTVTVTAPSEKQAGHDVWNALTDDERDAVIDIDAFEVAA